MPAVRTQALVLRTTDVFETSLILSLYTRDLGKISVLAKGARRLRSPFRSSLDLLSRCDVVLIHKNTESLDLLTEASLLERFDSLRHDLNALYAGYYIAELLSALADHAIPHPRLFDAASITLRHLDNPNVRTLRVIRFELACLAELGHQPAFDHCVGCGQSLDTDSLSNPVGFGLATGGILCDACRPQHPHTTTLDPSTLTLLQILARPGNTWREQPSDHSSLAQARATLGAIISHLLGRRPRMLPYLEPYPTA